MKLSDLSTPTSIGVLIVLTITLVCQAVFNDRVLDLTEASFVPLVFAELDSLAIAEPPDHNVFYTVRNVGTMPAVKLRPGSNVNKQKRYRIKNELPDTVVVADLFPTEVDGIKSWHDFTICEGQDTHYFHVRLDFQDMLDRKYCYRATYHILSTTDTAQDLTIFDYGMEWSELKPLAECR